MVAELVEILVDLVVQELLGKVLQVEMVSLMDQVVFLIEVLVVVEQGGKEGIWVHQMVRAVGLEY